MVPNIIFVFIITIFTGYLTFLSTKGGFTDDRFSSLGKKFTRRGLKAVTTLIFITGLLVCQEINSDFIQKSQTTALMDEIKIRNELVEKGINEGIDSLNGQNKDLKKLTDSLYINSELQKIKITDLLEQNISLAIQLTESSKKLAFPLPKKLQFLGFVLKIKTDSLKKFIPELRNQFETNYGQKNYERVRRSKSHGFQLAYNSYSKELQNLFDGKRLVIHLNIQNEKSIDSLEPITNLHWAFETKFSLKNEDVNFSYVIDNSSNTDYFQLILMKANLDNVSPTPKNSEPLRVFNGISSATELCNKIVRVSVYLGNNRIVRPTNISFSHFKLRDENNRIYEVEYEGTKTYKRYWDETLFRTVFPNKEVENPWQIEYLEGKFKCLDF